MIRIFGRGCFYSMRSDDVYALQISLTYAETNDIVKFCFELRYRFVCLRCDSLSLVTCFCVNIFIRLMVGKCEAMKMKSETESTKKNTSLKEKIPYQ